MLSDGYCPSSHILAVSCPSQRIFLKPLFGRGRLHLESLGVKGQKMHKETPVNSFPLEEENDLKWVISFPVYLLQYREACEIERAQLL